MLVPDDVLQLAPHCTPSEQFIMLSCLFLTVAAAAAAFASTATATVDP
jgi:hypothetical protein